MKEIHKISVDKIQYLNVTADGTRSDHWALNDSNNGM